MHSKRKCSPPPFRRKSRHAFAVPPARPCPHRSEAACHPARQHSLRAGRWPPHRRVARARPARAADQAVVRRARCAPEPAAARQPGRRRTLPARAPRLADHARRRAGAPCRRRPVPRRHHAAAAARRGAPAALAGRQGDPARCRWRRPAVHRARLGRRRRPATRAARFLRGAGARRRRPLAAEIHSRPAARAAPDRVQAHQHAMGLAGAGRHPGAGPVAGAGTTVRVRIRAGPRALPPAARRPFAQVLARGRSALPGMARGAVVFQRRRAGVEVAPAHAAGR